MMRMLNYRSCLMSSNDLVRGLAFNMYRDKRSIMGSNLGMILGRCRIYDVDACRLQRKSFLRSIRASLVSSTDIDDDELWRIGYIRELLSNYTIERGLRDTLLNYLCCE